MTSDWHVPHFEKMLVDNAQLAYVYTNAFQLMHDSHYKEIAKRTLSFISSLQSKDGGFCTSEASDSELPNSGSKEVLLSRTP